MMVDVIMLDARDSMVAPNYRVLHSKKLHEEKWRTSDSSISLNLTSTVQPSNFSTTPLNWGLASEQVQLS